jgi:hypothetical protein
MENETKPDGLSPTQFVGSDDRHDHLQPCLLWAGASSACLADSKVPVKGEDFVTSLRPLLGAHCYTASLAALTGRARTIFRAGLALKVIGSPVKGLVPLRALVAGFLMTTNFAKPGTTNALLQY